MTAPDETTATLYRHTRTRRISLPRVFGAGLVIAHKDEPCAPAWGAEFDIQSAASEFDLDRRIARLRQTGRDVLISFGGAINDELATLCTNIRSLTDAYASVVEHYEVTTIDLDIEGKALLDTEANARRAAAIAAVQDDVQSNGSDLAVWLTLPSSPSGLTSDGIAVVDAMLEAGVDLAGVNLMTMNFGLEHSGQSMIEATEAALEAGITQVLTSWKNAGLAITRGTARQLIGAAPMIGRNDIVTDVFTLDDAKALEELVQHEGYGRVSCWSLNRDLPCSANNAPIASTSNHCSHEEQEALSYAKAFLPLVGRDGDATGYAFESKLVSLLEDDAERSPYPLWRAGTAFESNEKVVWHGYVYQAKWWTSDDNPEAPYENEWDSPWRLVGPVLPEDLRDPIIVPAGVVPAWDGEVVYEQGDEVWLDGSVYGAKWWTQRFQPNRVVNNDAETPWKELDPAAFVQAS